MGEQRGIGKPGKGIAGWLQGSRIKNTSVLLQKKVVSLSYSLDIFETPVTVTHPQKISQTLNSAKNSRKMLNVYFGGDDVYFWGNNVYFWGFSKIWGIFETSFFVAGGFGNLWVRGGPIGVFENISKL